MWRTRSPPWREMTTLSANLKLYPQINYHQAAPSERLNKSILNFQEIIVRMTLGKEHFIPQSSIELIGRRPADCQVMHGAALSLPCFVCHGVARQFVNICWEIKSQTGLQEMGGFNLKRQSSSRRKDGSLVTCLPVLRNNFWICNPDCLHCLGFITCKISLYSEDWIVPSSSQLHQDVPEIQDVNDSVSVDGPYTAPVEVSTSRQSFSSVRPILNLKPVPEIVKPAGLSPTKRPHKERLFSHYKSMRAGTAL